MAVATLAAAIEAAVAVAALAVVAVTTLSATIEAAVAVVVAGAITVAIIAVAVYFNQLKCLASRIAARSLCFIA